MSPGATLPSYSVSAIHVHWPVCKHRNNLAARQLMSSEQFTKRNLARHFQTRRSRRLHSASCAFSVFFINHPRTSARRNRLLSSRTIDVPFWYVSIVYPQFRPFLKLTTPCPDISSIAASHLKPKTGKCFPLSRKRGSWNNSQQS